MLQNKKLKTPEEVARTIYADFKINSFSREIAATKLGMKSKQTLTNILCSKKYFSKKQAERFHQAFGYSIVFLTSGKGSLYNNITVNDSSKIKVQNREKLAFKILCAVITADRFAMYTQSQQIDYAIEMADLFISKIKES